MCCVQCVIDTLRETLVEAKWRHFTSSYFQLERERGGGKVVVDEFRIETTVPTSLKLKSVCRWLESEQMILTRNRFN